jgi:hypothetical protein
VKYLNDGQELEIGNDIKIKSLQIDDREVLRIFKVDNN